MTNFTSNDVSRCEVAGVSPTPNAIPPRLPEMAEQQLWRRRFEQIGISVDCQDAEAPALQETGDVPEAPEGSLVQIQGNKGCKSNKDIHDPVKIKRMESVKAFKRGDGIELEKQRNSDAKRRQITCELNRLTECITFVSKGTLSSDGFEFAKAPGDTAVDDRMHNDVDMLEMLVFQKLRKGWDSEHWSDGWSAAFGQALKRHPFEDVYQFLLPYIRATLQCCNAGVVNTFVNYNAQGLKFGDRDSRPTHFYSLGNDSKFRIVIKNGDVRVLVYGIATWKPLPSDNKDKKAETYYFKMMTQNLLDLPPKEGNAFDLRDFVDAHFCRFAIPSSLNTSPETVRDSLIKSDETNIQSFISGAITDKALVGAISVVTVEKEQRHSKYAGPNFDELYRSFLLEAHAGMIAQGSDSQTELDFLVDTEQPENYSLSSEDQSDESDVQQESGIPHVQKSVIRRLNKGLVLRPKEPRKQKKMMLPVNLKRGP